MPLRASGGQGPGNALFAWNWSRWPGLLRIQPHRPHGVAPRLLGLFALWITCRFLGRWRFGLSVRHVSADTDARRYPQM